MKNHGLPAAVASTFHCLKRIDAVNSIANSTYEKFNANYPMRVQIQNLLYVFILSASKQQNDLLIFLEKSLDTFEFQNENAGKFRKNLHCLKLTSIKIIKFVIRIEKLKAVSVPTS